MKSDRLIRRREAYALTGLTRYMLDLLEQSGAFPTRIRVGQRAVFWSLNEVTEFVERTKEKRGSTSDWSRRLQAEQTSVGDQP